MGFNVDIVRIVSDGTGKPFLPIYMEEKTSRGGTLARKSMEKAVEEEYQKKAIAVKSRSR